MPEGWRGHHSHMGIGSHYSVLPNVLERDIGMPVRHAEDNESLVPGTVLIAPPDHHMPWQSRKRCGRRCAHCMKNKCCSSAWLHRPINRDGNKQPKNMKQVRALAFHAEVLRGVLTGRQRK
jgi:hypothetical protein